MTDRSSGAWASTCGALAISIPGGLGVWLATPAALWRSDAAALTLWGAPPGWQGLCSSLLGQLVQVVPVGSTVSRAASLGGVTLGVAGTLVFRLVLGLLERSASAPRLNSVLALCSAVASAASLAWLAEGTTLGGQALGATLGLAVLAAAGVHARAGAASGCGRAVGVGALLAATALESLWAAGVVLPGLLVLQWQRGRLPERSSALAFGAAGLTVLAAGWGPAALAPLAAPLRDITAETVAGLQAGVGVEVLALDGPRLHAEDWLAEVGLVFLVAAAVGLAHALLRRRLRWAVAPFVLVLLLDVLLPGASGGELEPRSRTAVHLLGLAALTCLAALGLQLVAVLAERARLVGTRAAAALLGVFTVAMTWAGAEDAYRVAARKNVSAADTWTDEVLAGLPPGSLLVVNSKPLVRRLAAGIASGARSDVVVVPLPLLGQGSLAAELLELEPALALLIRDLSTGGRPTEQALTALADVRPLFLEADPEWDGRLTSHLVPGPFLARFAPHPLGRSDRRGAVAGQDRAFHRVMSEALPQGSEDRATLSVLHAGALRQRTLLELLGDREEAEELGQRLERLSGSEPEARGLPRSSGPLALR